MRTGPNDRVTVIERWTNGGRPIDRGTVMAAVFLALVCVVPLLYLLTAGRPGKGTPFRGQVIQVSSHTTGSGINLRIKWEIEVDVEGFGPRRYKFHRFADNKVKLIQPGDQIEFYVDDGYISELTLNGNLLMSNDQYINSIWRWYYTLSCCSVPFVLGLLLVAANGLLRLFGFTDVSGSGDA